MKQETLLVSAKMKRDEYYTHYDTIAAEFDKDKYNDYFRNKCVYCNCDDYRFSNFAKYFVNNYERLGLSQLICTCYNEHGHGICWIYDGNTEIEKEMCGDGSYSSEECLDILQLCDVVVTNPPFSKMRDYINVIKAKPFIVLANWLVFTTRDVAKMFCDGAVFPITFNTDESFDNAYDKEKNTIHGIIWMSNDVLLRNPSKILKTNVKFDDIKDSATYLEFFDEPILYIDKIKDIPSDYQGKMAVPANWIWYHDVNQYNIWSRHDTIAYNCFGTYDLNKAHDIVKCLDYRVDLTRFVIKKNNKYKTVFYRYIIQKK